MKKLLFLCIATLLILNMSAQWQQSNGPFGGSISATALNSTAIFAGTSYNGLFRSTDDGETWSSVNDGILNTYITAIAANDSIVLVGTYNGLFLSTNNGNNWTSITTNLSQTWITSIIISNNGIYVGTFDGVHFSSDSGASWTALNNGFPSNIINAMAMNGSNIIAGTDGEGIYQSTDGGWHWHAINTGLPTDAYVHALTFKGNDIYAGTWYEGGIFISTDNGLNWTAINGGLTNLWINTLYVNNNKIYSGTYDGLFVSNNNGNNWSSLNINLEANTINTLASNDSTLFCGTDREGMHRSIDEGASWITINNGIISTWIYTLATNGPKIFAAGDFEGTFYSTDSGINWNHINNSNIEPYSLATCGNQIFAATTYGVFRSPDDGLNWYYANNGLPNYFWDLRLAASGTTLFAGSYEGIIYRSDDFGNNWTTIYTGTNCSTIWANGLDIFVGDYGRLILSHDGGVNWSTVTSALPNNAWIHAFEIVDNTLFAGTAGEGVYKSTDGGETWSFTGMDNSFVQTLTSSGSYLFAGTGGYGVYVSSDFGTSWNTINEGLTNKSVEILDIHMDYIIAGTFFGGVWKRPLSELVGINQPDLVDSKLIVYPNPASDVITIDLQGINLEKEALLAIFNAQGQLLTQKRTSNKHLEFNISNYPQGTYIIKVVDENCNVQGSFIKK